MALPLGSHRPRDNGGVEGPHPSAPTHPGVASNPVTWWSTFRRDTDFVEAMSSVADSITSFSAALADMGLTTLQPKFELEGWVTYNDFAFASSDQTGKDTTAFEREVLAKLVDIS